MPLPIPLYEDPREWERFYKEHCPVVRAVVSRVRNQEWRKDAEQQAWEGILKSLRRGRVVNTPVVVRISINAANTIFRSHQRDPISIEVVFSECEQTVAPDGSFYLELAEWLIRQRPTHRCVMEHVLSGTPYQNVRDLGLQLGLSKSTCARALSVLEEYLKEG